MLSGTMGTCNMHVVSFLTSLLGAATTLMHLNAVLNMHNNIMLRVRQVVIQIHQFPRLEVASLSFSD
jgi:hypothetical protein